MNRPRLRWPQWVVTLTGRGRGRRAMPHPLHVRSGRNPFQRFVMACGVLSGLVGLVGGRGYRSQALIAAAPPMLLTCFYLALALSSAAVLTLIVPRERPINMFDRAAREQLRTGLQYEAIGLAAMSCTSVGFAAMIVGYAGTNGQQVALTYVAFLCAAVSRIREIYVDLRKLARAERNPTLLDTPTVADPGRR